MRVFKDEDVRRHLAQSPEFRCDDKVLRFLDPEANAIRVNLRLPEPHQLVFLARLAASVTEEEQEFSGACLWITQWGVWTPFVESIGLNALERYRQGFGDNRPLTSAPGHFFRQDEFLNSVACLVQPMLVGWDGYYIPQFAGRKPEFFLFVSHDSFLDIKTRTHDVYDKVLKKLKRFEWLRPEL